MPIIPWGKILIGAAIIAAILVVRAHWIGVGEERCQTKWDEAVEAQRQEAENKKDLSNEVIIDTAKEATEVVAETREQTSEAAESVRVEVREHTAKAPTVCRNAMQLPASVQNKGRDAVERARAAMHTDEDS